MKMRLICAALVFSMSTALSAQDEIPAVATPAEVTPADATPVAATAEAAPAAPVVDPMAATDALIAELGLAKPGDAAAGETKVIACAACHGADGNAAAPLYPKLAGQHEHYIAKQLALFKTGVRANAIMLGFSAALSAQDMRDIGAYFAKQKINAGLADESKIANEFSPNNGLRVVDVGARLYRGGDATRGIPACTACHGPSGRGMPGPSYPMVGGQHNGYLATMLTTFKATAPGAVQLNDERYAAMAQIAARLTEEEILAVSSYLEGLHTRADPAPAAAAP